MPVPVILFAIGGAAIGAVIAETLKPKKRKDDEVISENRSGERSDSRGDLPRSATESGGDGGIKPPSTVQPKPRAKEAENDSELRDENSGSDNPNAGGDQPNSTGENGGDGGAGE